jgi:hypothetical protein
VKRKVLMSSPLQDPCRKGFLCGCTTWRVWQCHCTCGESEVGWGRGGRHARSRELRPTVCEFSVGEAGVFKILQRLMTYAL